MSRKKDKVSAADVALYIISFFQEKEDPVTNLKLQKLLYYVQGWHLGLFGRPVFDEDFEAWVHGPVVPEIFRKYKENRWNPITVNDDESDPSAAIPSKLKKHIDSVLELYGGDTGWSLEMRTHREPPWKKARKGLAQDESSTEVITKKSMANFFEEEAVDG